MTVAAVCRTERPRRRSMHSHCSRTRLLFVAGSILISVVASTASRAADGYPRDAAAQRMILRAINELYLLTKFDEAENLLLATIRACGDRCSPTTIAQAWMYVGVIRSAGRGDEATAVEAFS